MEILFMGKIKDIFEKTKNKIRNSLFKDLGGINKGLAKSHEFIPEPEIRKYRKLKKKQEEKAKGKKSEKKTKNNKQKRENNNYIARNVVQVPIGNFHQQYNNMHLRQPGNYFLEHEMRNPNNEGAEVIRGIRKQTIENSVNIEVVRRNNKNIYSQPKRVRRSENTTRQIIKNYTTSELQNGDAVYEKRELYLYKEALTNSYGKKIFDATNKYAKEYAKKYNEENAVKYLLKNGDNYVPTGRHHS